MRIVSINANKGLNGGRRADLEAWLDIQRPRVLMLQEPVALSATLPVALAGLPLVAGNALVAVYALGHLDATTELVDERWLRLHIDSWTLDDVYLPYESSSGRQRFLERLAQRPAPRRLILGDFNLAPRAVDGRYGDEESAWTSSRERKAFAALLATGLVDLGVSDPHEYTFVRRNHGKWTRFRCDLALLSASEKGAAYWSDATVRNPTLGFTDHSAIVVDLHE
jgi:exonuclease III